MKWVGLLTVFLGSVAVAQTLQSKIENILMLSKRNHLEASISVMALDKQSVVYSLHPDKLLIPASVNKVFTSYTALKKFKPTYQFKTPVFLCGTTRDGKLLGDVYLVGSGDPSLVSERMWMLVNEFQRTGVREISGNIYGDGSYFDKETTPNSRPQYLTDQAYNAPIGALSFNFNTITVYVKPGESTIQRPFVYTEPVNYAVNYVEVVNQAETGPKDSKNTLSVKRLAAVKGDLGDTILLRGKIPQGSNEINFYKNIVDPTHYTIDMFRAFYEKQGGVIKGSISEKKYVSDPSCKLAFEFSSPPLWHMVWGLNKFSNNFIADQITKKMGAEAFGAPGTLEKGIKVIYQSLEPLGLTPKEATIADGSGLTRKSKVSANHLVKVLSSAYKDLSISAEFMASLGVAGADGTLRRRFLATPDSFVLRAKTGSLDGVASLAGYTTAANGEKLAFAIILNDRLGKYGRMTQWVDEIAIILSQYKGTTDTASKLK